MLTKICAGCGLEKEVEAFNFKNKAQGTRQIRCRSCTREQVKSHYKRNVEYYVEKARMRMMETKLLHRKKVLAYLSTHP